MESFFRYISYVDYYKKDEKVRNVGFLRWKLHNSEHRIELQIKDVYGAQGNFEIKEINTGKVIGNIKIDKGIGNFVKKFPSMTASGEIYIDTLDDRLYLDDVGGFVIQLDGNEWLSVDVNLEEEKKQDKFKIISNKEQKSNQEKKQGSDMVKYEKKMLSDERENKKVSEEIEAASENVLIEGITEKYIDEEKRKLTENYRLSVPEKLVDKYTEPISVGQIEKYTEPNPEKQIEKYTEPISENLVEKYKEPYKEIVLEKQAEKYIDSTQSRKIKIIEPIYEDKWKQLCKKYQQVHPFPDKRVFLTIKPDDFIILQQGYQKLVHNSFLLHGFYNYGHMILGKLSDEEGAPVYIGVPGVYYEREKQAAQMFGFVGFESTEHPVQAGSYGYYMIEVEI